ncbi:hypothetical protein Pfo_017829 [Paulownia fortunei]|nr:hypothetical protein Pfo_017829 [Paulownia fortunei]
MSVPQFGGWDGKSRDDQTNYSVVFSQARANRKKHKNAVNCHSLGNERELLRKHDNDDYSGLKKKKTTTCLSCFIGP